MKNDIIEINPDKVSGTPVFAGTRVPIKNLFDYLEGGETLEDFLEGFPPVSREQAVAVLEMAEKSLIREVGANWKSCLTTRLDEFAPLIPNYNYFVIQ